MELVAERVRLIIPSGSVVIPSSMPVAAFKVIPEGKEPELIV